MGLSLLLVWFFYCDIGHAHVHDSHVSDAFAEQGLSIDAVVGLKEEEKDARVKKAANNENEANLKTERYMIRNVSDIIIHFAKTPL